MLDDMNVIKQRDQDDALGVTARQYEQVDYVVALENPEHDGRELNNVVIAGMGGSALAADLAKVLLNDRLALPLEVIKHYRLPNYVNEQTLVIVSSNSGNTEETLACLVEARQRGAQIAATATGGTLTDQAREYSIMLAPFPHNGQPRMGMIYNLRAILTILVAFGVVSSSILDELAGTRSWLQAETEKWVKEVTTVHNYAKQLALIAVGKTAEFIGSDLTSSIAYKWKISWNENAKNVAYWGALPELNHNEFMGWTSHPIEKPFVIFDIRSDLDHPQIAKRFELTDRLLSGRRPKANEVWLEGDTLMKQLLWGCILADFVSVYVGILNGVDPTQVDLIEKFKKELAGEE